MNLDEYSLLKLKCDKCGLFLSCAPVFVTISGGNICGRCPTNDVSDVRNAVYETLASNVKFPCRYEKFGCGCTPNWIWVQEHEDNCVFREISCLFLGDCEWKGTKFDLEQHFKEKHENYLCFKQPLIVGYDFSKDFEQNILLSIFGFLFLVQVKISVDSDKIWHCIRYIGNKNCVTQFYGIVEIFKNTACFTDILQILPLSESMKIEEKQSHECDINGIKSILKTEEDIKFKISINKKIDLELLNNVKCIICRHLTKPPVYHIEEAPVCAHCAPTGSQIHSDLTHLGLQLLYSCIHKNKGCCHFDNLKYVWKHEIFFCKFFYCFICNLDTDETIESHFKKRHSVNIVTLEEMFSIELDDSENWFLLINEDKKFLGQYIFYENILDIKLCSNLSRELLNDTVCNLKLIDFRTKKSISKSMNLKMQDAFDWSITWHCKELLSHVIGNRINVQFELFKTVTAE